MVKYCLTCLMFFSLGLLSTCGSLVPGESTTGLCTSDITILDNTGDNSIEVDEVTVKKEDMTVEECKTAVLEGLKEMGRFAGLHQDCDLPIPQRA